MKESSAAAGSMEPEVCAFCCTHKNEASKRARPVRHVPEQTLLVDFTMSTSAQALSSSVSVSAVSCSFESSTSPILCHRNYLPLRFESPESSSGSPRGRTRRQRQPHPCVGAATNAGRHKLPAFRPLSPEAHTGKRAARRRGIRSQYCVRFRIEGSADLHSSVTQALTITRRTTQDSLWRLPRTNYIGPGPSGPAPVRTPDANQISLLLP